MNNKLAIVIPAFKINFFEAAISSIANQTCRDFTLYIGNDASNDDFEAVIYKYKHLISVTYKKFNKNFGQKDLVGHWERCIEMAGPEEWIWLFSDDDVMDSNCVESFYTSLNCNGRHFKLYHFNVSQIDMEGKVTGSFYSFPDIMTSEEFVLTRLKKPGNFSVVIEYIFDRSYFSEKGGFVNFDLAWGTDDATWITLADKAGIKTIGDAKVYWRKSRFNITPNNWDKDITKRKLIAQVQFGKWILEKIDNNELQIKSKLIKDLLTLWLLRSMKDNTRALSFSTIVRLITIFNSILGNNNFPFRNISLLFSFKVYYYLKVQFVNVITWDSSLIKNNTPINSGNH